MITLFPIFVSLIMKHNFFSVYIIPFAMAPIFVRVFMDSRTAFITHVTMILICAAAVKYQYEFIIVQLVAGLVAIYSLRELSKRSQIFITALLVTIASGIVYLALQLMQDNQVFNVDASMYTYFTVNGIFLLLSYPLMYIIEKMFGFTSNVTLFELSNTNKGLLRNLSEIAPGTFQILFEGFRFSIHHFTTFLILTGTSTKAVLALMLCLKLYYNILFFVSTSAFNDNL